MRKTSVACTLFVCKRPSVGIDPRFVRAKTVGRFFLTRHVRRSLAVVVHKDCDLVPFPQHNSSHTRARTINNTSRWAIVAPPDEWPDICFDVAVNIPTTVNKG